jgi:hypothetical protein
MPLKLTVGLSKKLGLPEYGSVGAVGIREDESSHVFDRFYRAGNARSRADGGSGLGLSICRTIIEAHGGTIMAQSEPNAGTTFEIHLPISSASGTLSESLALVALRPVARRLFWSGRKYNRRWNQVTDTLNHPC